MLVLILYVLASATDTPKVGPAAVACEYKPMLNLPDLIKAKLVRRSDGKYDFTLDNTVKPETRKALDCRFDTEEPGVYACMDTKGAWGAFAKRTRERSLDSAGNVETFDGYVVELVKNPLGEPTTFRNAQIPATGCSVSP